MSESQCNDIEDMLEGILGRRVGTELHEYDGFTDSEQDIHLHQKIEYVTPKELVSVLEPAVEGILEIKKGDKTKVCLTTPFGLISIQSTDKVWKEEYPSENLTITISFENIFFNNIAALNDINIKYPIACAVKVNDRLECRHDVTLKGGRSVENFLWEFIAFSQTAERVYKDLTVFL